MINQIEVFDMQQPTDPATERERTTEYREAFLTLNLSEQSLVDLYCTSRAQAKAWAASYLGTPDRLEADDWAAIARSAYERLGAFVA